MHLYLVRHTKPQVEAGICYGQTDLEVAESFTNDATEVQKKLAHLSHAKLISSPLQRCSKLAKMFSHLGEVTYDTRIMELNFGDWEMQKWDDIPNGVIEQWAEDHVQKAPPNGESFHALSQRCISFIEEVSTNTKDENIIIFTHAGAIRAMLAYVLGLPLQNAFRLHADYASVSVLHLQDNLKTVIKLNY